MPVTVTCPHCAETLDVPNDLIGSSVRCSSCRNVFTADAGGPRPARPARPVAAAPEFPDDARRSAEDADRRTARTDDDRPRRRGGRAEKKSGRGWLWGLLLVGGGLLTCGCCGGLGWMTWAAMNPDFKPYSDPAGFTARFPGKPTPTTRLTGRKGETADSVESKRPMFQEAYFVYHFPLTAADKKKPSDKLLDEIADALLAANPGATEIDGRGKRAHDGHDALDVSLELPDDNKFTVARVVIAGGRAYVVGVTGPGQPGGAPWVDEFKDGLKINAPPARKADEKAPPEEKAKKKNPFGPDDDD